MYDVAPSLSRYDIIEPASLAAVGMRFVGELNKGSKSTGEALENPIKDFYLTDVISRRYKTSPFSFVWGCANGG